MVIVLFDLVPLCQVSQCQVSRFQRPPFNMLLQATMLKPACIVGAINFSGSHSRVAFVKGCGTNEESDWFNNFIFNFNSRN